MSIINEIYLYTDEKLKEVERQITSADGNQEIVSSLVSKLSTHLTENLPDRDLSISSVRDKILKRLSNTRLAAEDLLKKSIGNVMTKTVDKVFTQCEDMIQQLSNKVSMNVDQLKNQILNNLTNTIQPYLNGNMNQFAGQILNLVTHNMNVTELSKDFSSVDSLVSGMFNGALGGIQSSFNQLINSFKNLGNQDPSQNLDSIINSISSTFSQFMDGSKLQELTNLGNNILGSIKNLTNFSTSNILNAILPDRQMIKGLESSIKNLENLASNMGSNNPLKDAATKTLSNANESVNTSNGAPDGSIPGSNQSADTPSNHQDASSDPVDTNARGMNNNPSNDRKAQQAQESKANRQTQTTTQNRNESMDSSSTPSKDSNPELEQYDNSKPERAKGSSDPRRDNCQELVLWETDKEHYVLLRDAKGNYVLLDEDKNLIRIQHSSGSYIQLGTNIDIEAAGNVNINCAGASYVKQF